METSFFLVALLCTHWSIWIQLPHHSQRNWSTSRQQMTCSHPEVIVMSVIQYTHTQTALSNCSLLLESKQCCDRELNQGKQRDSSQMDWKDRNRKQIEWNHGDWKEKRKDLFQVCEVFTFKSHNWFLTFYHKCLIRKSYCILCVFFLLCSHV